MYSRHWVNQLQNVNLVDLLQRTPGRMRCRRWSCLDERLSKNWRTGRQRFIRISISHFVSVCLLSLFHQCRDVRMFNMNHKKTNWQPMTTWSCCTVSTLLWLLETNLHHFGLRPSWCQFSAAPQCKQTGTQYLQDLKHWLYLMSVVNDNWLKSDLISNFLTSFRFTSSYVLSGIFVYLITSLNLMFIQCHPLLPLV